MRIFENQHQKRRVLLIFLLVVSIILFAMMMWNISAVLNNIKKVLLFFTSFYIGFGIAFILNSPLVFMEEKIFFKIKKPKIRRIVSVTVLYIIFSILLVGFMAFIFPDIISNISSFVNNIPTYINNLSTYVNNFVKDRPAINEFYENNRDTIGNYINQAVNLLSGYLSSLLPKLVNMTAQVTNTVVNIFVGIIISIYMLLSKEKLIAQIKKTLYAIFSDEIANKILRVSYITNTKMSQFLSSRLLDTVIITVLCYICMTIFNFPYALLNSLIIGILNIIPFFGSILGAIPPAIIILLVKPSAFIYFIIFIILLQQVDGNIIGPRLSGKSLGLPAIWIMFAIFLFGGLFGFIGLLIGVPIFAVIYFFVCEAINEGLVRKGKSSKTVDYADPDKKDMI